jgi:hypothetical protein
MAVINIFASASGINFFHPRSINWSYLNLGIVHLTHMNKKRKKMIFANNATNPKIATVFAPKVKESVASSTNGIS